MKIIFITSFFNWLKRLIVNVGLIIKETFIQYIDDKAFKMAAAISFYTLFSLSPFLIITISIVGKIYGPKATTGELLGNLTNLIGAEGAQVIQSLIANISGHHQDFWATAISIFVLLFSSVIVFVELKESLNMIWGVELIPGRPYKNLLLDRALALVMVLGAGLLFFASLLFNSLLQALSEILGNHIPQLVPMLKWINRVPLLFFSTLAFVLIFRFLPDVKVKWRFLWVGAIVTSLLFFAGRSLIGLYLGNISWTSIFGAASSLVALLLWIYYSALIFFFGAELTQVMRNHYSQSSVSVSERAVAITKTSKLIARKVKEKKQPHAKKK